jgi:CRP/FNR family cyclic AMP-dependent transcriptional regulator
VHTTYDLLRQQPFLAGLTDWQLERLARHGRRAVLPAGTTICRTGEWADRLWLIVTGEVAVREPAADGSAVTVETLGPGAVVGWSSMVPPYRSRFDATPGAHTLAVEFDGTALREMCERDPLMGYVVVRALLVVLADRIDTHRSVSPAA